MFEIMQNGSSVGLNDARGTPFLCGPPEGFPRPFSDPRHSLTYTQVSLPVLYAFPPALIRASQPRTHRYFWTRD
ncbi:hypothetical protein RSOLAG1IB_02301 [Rhizoctonia solani AG-1 IB]|uniref:Uncharacterized protein n=1 Tax=Thanatephorus cucumeris (strain AG1-IB / isolate 7/3/14) TaxID=1108050 RepID=A0A0B7FL10_THACB|nr:hypothetical protein RSOLAG1IB_02301 [Rhizoctonia solani AG-1 IB]